ncbi:Putative Holin-X, holin superfamily III [Rhizobiales bacterium GAS191]|nr:Putative Holin-X, holin superfamily III [Rhizobiales bacterium GAS191]
MTYAPQSTSTRQLAADLVSQVSDLISIESRLIRAELSEAAAKAASGLAFLAGGFAITLASVFILLAGAAALLVRLGMPPDVACFIVASATMVVGGILLFFGMRALKPARLVPVRSLDQLSSLIRSR